MVTRRQTTVAVASSVTECKRGPVLTGSVSDVLWQLIKPLHTSHRLREKRISSPGKLAPHSSSFRSNHYASHSAAITAAIIATRQTCDARSRTVYIIGSSCISPRPVLIHKRPIQYRNGGPASQRTHGREYSGVTS